MRPTPPGTSTSISAIRRSKKKRNRFSVRCVRTAVARPAVPKRYDVQAETVRDVATGLTWQRAVPSGQFKFDAARAYCAQLALSGKKGWRVPTLTELLTLIDERAGSPMIDRGAFPNTPGEQFWTSTNFSGGRLEGWYVYFSHGDALYDFVASPYRVRCVILSGRRRVEPAADRGQGGVRPCRGPPGLSRRGWTSPRGMTKCVEVLQ